MGKEDSSPEETRFFVTLMMSRGDKDGGEGYVPKDNKKRGKEECGGSDTSSERNNKVNETKLLSGEGSTENKEKWEIGSLTTVRTRESSSMSTDL